MHVTMNARYNVMNNRKLALVRVGELYFTALSGGGFGFKFCFYDNFAACLMLTFI